MSAVYKQMAGASAQLVCIPGEQSMRQVAGAVCQGVTIRSCACFCACQLAVTTGYSSNVAAHDSEFLMYSVAGIQQRCQQCHHHCHQQLM